MSFNEVSIQLASLWKDVLIAPMPLNAQELWKDHLLIHNTFSKPFAFQNAFEHNKDRRSKIDEFKKWAKTANITYEGVDIYDTPNAGFSLKAKADFDVKDLVVGVPPTASLSLDYATRCPTLVPIFENDHMIKIMDNVGLAMIVAHELLCGEESPWFAYLDTMPATFSTPLFYTLEELESLKPSPAFEDALKMHRSIARQYVYFFLRILSETKTSFRTKLNRITNLNKDLDRNIFSSSPFTAEGFTYDLYRWCVGLVTTRINTVPSAAYRNLNGELRLVPVLLPFIDLSNHSQDATGSIFFDAETDFVYLQLKKAVKAGDELSINYGSRSSKNFLLHNGFVPPLPNPCDKYELKIGMSKSGNVAFKLNYLDDLGITPSIPERNIYRFSLAVDCDEDDGDDTKCNESEEKALWEFAKAFVAKSPEELESKDSSTIENLEQRAAKFLMDRFNLILLAYAYLPEEEPALGNEEEFAKIAQMNVWRLKKSEKLILEHVRNKFSLKVP